MKCRLCVQQGRAKPNQIMNHGGNGLCSVHYRRKLAYRGNPQGWVPADEARAHMQKLRAGGMRFRRMAAVVEMNEDSIRKIFHGTRNTIQAATEEKILAIQPGDLVGELVDRSQILSVGSIRRLRALVAIGYSQQEIADRIGLTRDGVSRVIGGRYKLVHAQTAEAIAKLFNELGMTKPPETPEVKKAKSIAKRHGWLPPLAWDEDEIDDPKAKPHARELRTVREKPDWYTEYEELKGMGHTNEAIAKRWGISRSTLQKRLERLSEVA